VPGGPVYGGGPFPSIRSSGGGPAYSADTSFSAPAQSDLFSRHAGRAYPISQVGYARIGGKDTLDLIATPASTPLYAVPAGKKAVIRYIVLRCTEATAVTAAAFASVGVGASPETIYEDQQLLGLTVSGKRFVFPNGPGSQDILSAGEVLSLTISAAAEGNSQAVDVDVFGDEFN